MKIWKYYKYHKILRNFCTVLNFQNFTEVGEGREGQGLRVYIYCPLAAGNKPDKISKDRCMLLLFIQ
jgi:hypothetical protein